MAFSIASRLVSRWFVVVVLASLLAGFYFQDREDCRCHDPELQDAVHRMEVQMRFFDILHDRATRWLADHPDRSCPRIEDIAAPTELWKHNVATVELVCGDRQYFGRRVVVTTTKPLVQWPTNWW